MQFYSGDETRQIFYGSSTETKPTPVKIGSIIYELDTGDSYVYDGTDWITNPFGSGGSGGGSTSGTVYWGAKQW